MSYYKNKNEPYDVYPRRDKPKSKKRIKEEYYEDFYKKFTQ
tara:strand:- start:1505 stop:1627 length:123 start_codon:yes stop_codon:yes gene_type:complete